MREVIEIKVPVRFDEEKGCFVHRIDRWVITDETEEYDALSD